MNEMNRAIAKVLIDEGCGKEKILTASGYKGYFITAEPLDPGNHHNRSGKPKSVHTRDILRALDAARIVILHSVGIGSDGKTTYNINGDDYAMAMAIELKAKRLILVTNVMGVYDKKRERIPAIDQAMADQLITDGVITGGMVPKVESALWVVKQGVGGVAIIDGHRPWAILAEMLTHEGFGTLFQTQVG
jgi:acetylglutamate kinase